MLGYKTEMKQKVSPGGSIAVYAIKPGVAYKEPSYTEKHKQNYLIVTTQ